MKIKSRFWSTKKYTTTSGLKKEVPCYYEKSEKGSIALYIIWHPVCLQSSPEAAIARAKELSKETGDPFLDSPLPLVPYPS